MNTSRRLPILLTCLLTTPVWAQSARPPLNLKLPPGALPAPASSSAKPASSAPGMYYGDTSNHVARTDTTTTCDDASYSQPQVHGNVGMGVMAGHHASGSYQSGTVNITKQLGGCDQPKGAVSFSIGVSQGHLHGRGW